MPQSNNSDRKSHAIETIAAASGFVALAVEAIGLLAAALTPPDNQGTVGKAIVFIVTQVVAIPVSLLGILLGIAAIVVTRRCRLRVAVGLACSAGTLVVVFCLFEHF